MNKYHFQEINWVIYFPSTGNEGRQILKYGIAYRDRENSRTQSGPRINLEDVLRLPKIHDQYPHTVGYFHKSTGKGKNWMPYYITVKVISDEKHLLEWFYKIEGSKWE